MDEYDDPTLIEVSDNYYNEKDEDEYYDSIYEIPASSVATDDSTVFTQVNTKNTKNKKKLDSGHRVIGKKNNKWEYFATNNMPGSNIRNAVTGIPEINMKVGNAYAEDQFFKVTYAGIGINEGNPDTLFYETPEQCERHMKCKIKTNIKKNWQERYDRFVSFHSE